MADDVRWTRSERSGMPSHEATFQWRNCTVTMRWTQGQWSPDAQAAAEEVVACFPAQLHRHPALTPYAVDIVRNG